MNRASGLDYCNPIRHAVLHAVWIGDGYMSINSGIDGAAHYKNVSYHQRNLIPTEFDESFWSWDVFPGVPNDPGFWVDAAWTTCEFD